MGEISGREWDMESLRKSSRTQTLSADAREVTYNLSGEGPGNYMSPLFLARRRFLFPDFLWVGRLGQLGLHTDLYEFEFKLSSAFFFIK